jgi:hypothetical protein
LTFSSCIPPFAGVTLTLEDGAFSTAWRRAMATGFLSLFYLTFLPAVFFPRQPIDAKEPHNARTLKIRAISPDSWDHLAPADRARLSPTHF